MATRSNILAWRIPMDSPVGYCPWDCIESDTTEVNQHAHRHAHLEMGLPPWLSIKESTCSAGDTGDVGSISGSGRYPGDGYATQPRESHGPRSLEGRSPWGCKESDMTEVTKHTQLFLCPEFLVFSPINDTAPVLLLIVSMLFIRHCFGHISGIVKHHFFKSGKEKPQLLHFSCQALSIKVRNILQMEENNISQTCIMFLHDVSCMIFSKEKPSRG